MTAKVWKRLKKNKGIFKKIIPAGIVIGLAVLPLFMVKDAEFGGTDDKAVRVITEINTGYKPWFSPLFEPKSQEMESSLFALQAAVGAGVVGYGIGYMRGRKKKEEAADHDLH